MYSRHLVLLIAVFRYSLSLIRFNYNGTAARYSYRIAFVAAAVTYGIVVYKTLKARAKAGSKQAGGPMAIASDENVQYLGEQLMFETTRRL
jgi:transmembrane protein 33